MKALLLFSYLLFSCLHVSCLPPAPTATGSEPTFTNTLYFGCYHRYKRYFLGPTEYPLADGASTHLKVGSYLVLKGGSVWKMANSDFWRISEWSTSDRLQLTRNPSKSSSIYPYLLRNLENHETMQVMVCIGPRDDSSLFCTCTRCDLEHGGVWCSNNTVWWVPEKERENLKTWRAKDVIMFGVNEDPTRLKFPYLLLNLTSGSSCRCAWVP